MTNRSTLDCVDNQSVHVARELVRNKIENIPYIPRVTIIAQGMLEGRVDRNQLKVYVAESIKIYEHVLLAVCNKDFSRS